MKEASRLITYALAPSTSSSYNSSFNEYIRFCSYVRLSNELPPSVSTIIAFITHLFRKHHSYDKIRKDILGLKSACVDAGVSMDNFAVPLVNRTLRGIKRIATPPAKRVRKPITLDLLRSVIPHFHNSNEGKVMRSMAIVSFWGLMRAGEVTARAATATPPLLRKDITWCPTMVKVTIQHNKTSLSPQQVMLFQCGGIACPFSALLYAWNNAAVKIPHAPVFQDSAGKAIKYTAFQTELRFVLSKAGLDPLLFNTHSLRYVARSSRSATICY